MTHNTSVNYSTKTGFTFHHSLVDSLSTAQNQDSLHNFSIHNNNNNEIKIHQTQPAVVLACVRGFVVLFLWGSFSGSTAERNWRRRFYSKHVWEEAFVVECALQEPWLLGKKNSFFFLSRLLNESIGREVAFAKSVRIGGIVHLIFEMYPNFTGYFWLGTQEVCR